jgi:uncharacterized LabA/DUF88 family protein
MNNNNGGGDNIAVLIDADNVPSRIIAGLMTEVANYGTASVRRIYGDWTSPGMKGWRGCLLEHSIVPIQQFAYTTGKNATDGAMIIDAMDLLYTGRFSSFCLVTSDSDFTRLASRIREQGIQVYGFGNKHNTHRAFIAACNKFVYLDALPGPPDEKEDEIAASGGAVSAAALPTPPTPSKQTLSSTTNTTLAALEPHPLAYRPTSPAKVPEPHPLAYRPASPSKNKTLTPVPSTTTTTAPTPAPAPAPAPRLDRTAIKALRKAIMNSPPYDSAGFVNLADVGNYLIKLSPDLNARNYGFQRLWDFVVASGIVETTMRERMSGNGPPLALIKLKD